ncbi:MAG: Gfo/Idh/MocA family protein, partial [Eubacteriales bacterium]
MYKIAIIGSENSHCGHFAAALAPKNGEKLFPELELVGVCGDDSSNEAVAKNCTCKCFTNDPAAFVGKVDCVMVTSRHGGLHLPYAKPYLAAGCDLWLDKPITTSVEDARELVRLVHEKGVLLCGGSSLAGAAGTIRMKECAAANAGKILGGHVTAPVNLVNAYGGFWFYSQHLVQMITEVFGQNIDAVEAMQNVCGVRAVYHYPSFDVTAFFGAGYSITIYTGAYGAVSEVINLPGDYFMPELRETADMLLRRRVRQTPEEVVYPVLVLDATVRALSSGCTEKVAAL